MVETASGFQFFLETSIVIAEIGDQEEEDDEDKNEGAAAGNPRRRHRCWRLVTSARGRENRERGF